MINSYDSSIRIAKGDNERLRFNALLNGTPHDITGELYYFTVKKDTAQSSPVLIQKIVTNQATTFFEVVLTSEDTNKLEYGTYVWDLRCKIGVNEISTPILVKTLEILEVVGNV